MLTPREVNLIIAVSNTGSLGKYLMSIANQVRAPASGTIGGFVAACSL